MLSRVSGDLDATEIPSLNKLIVVMGSKGGVGTTTVTVNLGVQLATFAHKRVVILDFARPLGNVHLLLDLHPRFGVRDAVENLNRLDSHFFSGLLTQHKTKLEILGGDSAAGRVADDSRFHCWSASSTWRKTTSMSCCSIWARNFPRNGARYCACPGWS